MRVIVLLLLFWFPVYSWAGVNDILSRNETKTNLDFLHATDNWRAQGLDKIEASMQNMNPELVEQMRDKSEIEKLDAYKSWLAMMTFDDFYKKYMDDLERASVESNRKIDKRIIKDNEVAFIVEYKLTDDGIRTDCHTDKVFNDVLCFYPDGYVEYKIKYLENKKHKHKTMVVSKDVPDENRSSFYEFSLRLSGKSFMFGHSALDQDYQEVQQNRNLIIKDLLAGQCKETCRDCVVNNKVVTMYSCDTDPEIYKSNLIPMGVMTNYVVHYTNTSGY